MGHIVYQLPHVILYGFLPKTFKDMNHQIPDITVIGNAIVVITPVMVFHYLPCRCVFKQWYQPYLTAILVLVGRNKRGRKFVSLEPWQLPCPVLFRLDVMCRTLRIAVIVFVNTIHTAIILEKINRSCTHHTILT